MEKDAVQPRRHMDETRAATDAPRLEAHVLGLRRGVQETAARATTWLRRSPWWILAAGGLVGYELLRANTRPVGPVPTPPPRAAVTPPREQPPARVSPTAYEAPQPTPGQAAAPPRPGEPPRAAPSGSHPSAWALGGLGVTELARRVIAEIQEDDCLGRAAQLAYYFLFALFPFFLFLTTLLGYLPIPNLLDRLMDLLGQMLPGEALHLVQDNLRQLVSGQRGGLLSFGILAALWTSSGALTAIIDSLNRAYDVEEGRPFWKVRLTAIGLTVGLSVFMIASLVLLTFGPQLGGWVADLVGLGRVFEVTWNVARWPVIVGLLGVTACKQWHPDLQTRGVFGSHSAPTRGGSGLQSPPMSPH